MEIVDEEAIREEGGEVFFSLCSFLRTRNMWEGRTVMSPIFSLKLKMDIIVAHFIFD